jgi:folate-binding protein YgfZ
MINWHSFLIKNGALFSDKKEVSFINAFPICPPPTENSYFVPLTHMGSIQIEGVEAKKFLQGQVTCDVDQLSKEQGLFGALCNPKGRVLANFQLHETQDEKLLLIMHSSLIGITIQELTKYAVFSKVSITDSSELYVLFGTNFLHRDKVPNISSALYHKDGRSIISIPIASAIEFFTKLQRTSTMMSSNLWIYGDIQSGIPVLQKETSDLFVPQMLNLDYLDAISFTKGCYTGQEIVARMKYLGKLKRKMYRISRISNKIVLAGTPCYADNKKQISGYVVSCVQINLDLQELLIVLTDKAAESGYLMIDNAKIEKIEYLPLTYRTTN